MTDDPLLVPLTSGVPYYSLRHGQSVWSPRQKPSFMVYDDWDLFWIQRGAVTIAFKDRRRLVAGVDEFIVLPPFTPITMSAAKPGVVLAFAHFSFRLPRPFAMDSAQAKALEGDALGPGPDALLPMKFDSSEAPAVWQAYGDLLQLRPSPSEPWRIERALVTLVAKLAGFAVRRTRAHPSGMVLTPQRIDARVETVRQRIDADPSFHWRISALAAEVGISPSQLQRLHATAFGETLKHHIVSTRLRMAITLLRGRSNGRPRSIRDVSSACGFSSPNYFCRRFKAQFRITPLAYRNGEMTV
ncbi:MAG: helix-turn-helix transcriptional regulator [Planctomycetes bacterium]|nr:helix-turn-helix transcriptional regulator [Planctomycetota bacterium]